MLGRWTKCENLPLCFWAGRTSLKQRPCGFEHLWLLLLLSWLLLQDFQGIIHGAGATRVGMVHCAKLITDSFDRSNEAGFGQVNRHWRARDWIEGHVRPVGQTRIARG